MSGPKVVYEPTVGRWRVDSRLAEDSAWSELRRFSKPGKARKYAQQMKDEKASRRVRVVDTRELKIFEPTLGRWRVDCRLIEDEDPAWRELRWFSKPGKARKYAQRWKDEGSEWDVRVVDTRPDEDVERWFVEYQEDDGTWCGGGSFPSFEEAKNEACRISLFHTARVTDTAVGTSSACVYLSDDDVPLTLSQYQEQARSTAVYPSGKALEYLVAGLAGEVGELSSIYAKWCRGDQEFLDMRGLRAELGDVLWFVAMLAHELSYDLSTVAQNNLDKLADRANRGELKGNGDDR